MEELAIGATEATEVKVMAVTVVMEVVANEDMVEGAMVKIHKNFQQVQTICGRSLCIPCRPRDSTLLAKKNIQY